MELYRQAKLTQMELAEALGLSRLQCEALLKLLELAAERGLIELAPTLARPQASTFRLSPQLVAAVLERDVARRRRGR